MTLKIGPKREISAGSTDNVAVDMTLDLDGSEVVSTVDSVTEVGTSDLTLASAGTNAGTVQVNGVTVAIGKAVQFQVSGQVLGTTYEVKMTYTTDSSPARVLDRSIELVCV